MSNAPPQSETREALEAAIEENPEEVARLVERLGLVNEILDVTELASGALTDEMVQELAGTSAMLLESADGLATPETAELAETVGTNATDLNELAEAVVELQETGTVDDLVGLAHVVSLASGALDDEMVSSLAGLVGSLGEVADVAAEPNTARGIESLLTAVGEANDPNDPPKPVGMVGLLGAMRDPDVRAGLGVLVAMARALGGDVERRAEQ